MSNISKATLTPEDRKTFFRLFIPLIDCVNRSYEISDLLNEQMRKGIPSSALMKKVADFIWETPEIINDYIETLEYHNDLTVEDRAILQSWTRPIVGRFILERHLSKGSVFIDIETQKVYLVKGLTEPWSEMLSSFRPPILLNATLIPFQDCIISDGLVTTEALSFGPSIRNDFKELYMTAKQNGKIITTL